MEERERLWRQIRLLQGLINNHKNTHGDVPRPLPSVAPRWNNPRQPAFRRGTFSARYPQQPPRDFQLHQGPSWRKKYSLVNRPPGSACDIGSGGSASTSWAFGSRGDSQAPEPPESSPERHVDLTTDGNIVVGIQLPQRADPFGDAKDFDDVGSYCEFSGLKTLVTVPGDSKDAQKSLYMSQSEERRPSLSISFNSSHRFVSSAYVSVPDKPRIVCQASDVVVNSSTSCASTSESAVTLKSEPQQLSVVPDREPTQHLVQVKAEPLAPGQADCEQVTDASREPKLLGNNATHSRPAQTAALVAGVAPMKSSSPPDKKSSSLPTAPQKSHFHLRKKNSSRGKPATPKRSSPKGLVQITKHRLCRLPGSTREGRNNHPRGMTGTTCRQISSKGRFWDLEMGYQVLQEVNLMLLILELKLGWSNLFTLPQSLVSPDETVLKLLLAFKVVLLDLQVSNRKVLKDGRGWQRQKYICKMNLFFYTSHNFVYVMSFSSSYYRPTSCTCIPV
ncbi:hypothetical protein Q9966_013206 [Columba livia]|nr:hypothetical protein Q9966_013206 [Columba livia]